MTEAITVCPKCGSLTHYFEPDEGETTKGKVVCADCGAFIKRHSHSEITDISKWAVHDESLNDWIITFGKHNGQTIRNLVLKEFNYCDWLINKTDFPDKCPEFVTLLETIADEENVVF